MIAQKTDTTAPSARKSHIGIVYSILMVLLLLVLFLLSPANKVYASVVLTAVLVIATGLFGREELDETKMSLPMILCLFGLAGSILLTMAISPYSMRDLFIDTSFLLLTVLFFYCIRPSSFEISPFMKRVFFALPLRLCWFPFFAATRKLLIMFLVRTTRTILAWCCSCFSAGAGTRSESLA